MNKQILIWSAIIALTLCSTQFSRGDSMRCANRVLKSGDSMEMVRKRCGTPTVKDSGYETIYRNGLRTRTYVERWRYKARARKLDKIVVFNDGYVVKVIIGRRR